MSKSRVALLLGIAMLASPPARAGEVVVASVDASISHDADQEFWVVGNATLQVHVHADPGSECRLLRVVEPQTGRTWRIADPADGLLTIDGKVRGVGRKADGFVVDSVRAYAVPNGVQLDVKQHLDDVSLAVTRHYALYDGSPTVEVWTSVASLDRPHTLGDLNAFNLTVPIGTLRWVNGLQGDTADVDHPAAFTLRSQTLGDGEGLSLDAEGRASEETVPWIVVEGDQQTFFAGMMWSGAWKLTLGRSGSSLNMTGSLGPMSTSLVAGGSLDGPHGFVGVVIGKAAAATSALQTFIANGVRQGRSFTPLVTYNTWFAYGTHFDEDTLRREMDGMAALGAELFVVDAGWYVGAGQGGTFDFESGLGSWTPDPARFPSGLHALADDAHHLGMKFGLWVEPERVFLDTVNQPDLAQEPWLASVGGDYMSKDTAQVCLANPAARQWVLDELTRLIDSVQPDYLKWDNKFLDQLQPRGSRPRGHRRELCPRDGVVRLAGDAARSVSGPAD